MISPYGIFIILSLHFFIKKPKLSISHAVERNPILLITLTEEKFFMDNNAILIPANNNSISYFPVPIVTINEQIVQIEKLSIIVSELFQFIINDYPTFYNN